MQKGGRKITVAPEPLEIGKNIPEILQLMFSADLCLSIIAPTGSGKSLGIPQAIADLDYGSYTRQIKCAVVVPTRTAAFSLCERQRMLYQYKHPQLNPDSYIGYAAEGEVKIGSLITYMTAGHVRRRMLSYFQDGKARDIDFANVLVVDEAHTGSMDISIILSLWIQAASNGVIVPFPIITSATPTTLPPQLICNPYIIEVRAYPIDIQYLTKDIPENDFDTLYETTARKIIDYHKSIPINDGHILVFAAGSNEIDKIIEKLVSKGADPSMLILPAAGALSREELDKIYVDHGPGIRKIIISTNVAETSITIKDIIVVISTMYEKRQEASQNGSKRLKLHLISKDSAKQQAGRAGRTKPGICLRMCTEEKYDRLEEHRPPDIQRIPIHDVVIELWSVGLNPISVLQGASRDKILESVNLLFSSGMLEDTLGIIKTTPSGTFAADLPISVQNASFLWQWIQNGYPLLPGIVLTILIDSYGPSYFWIPRKESGENKYQYENRRSAHKEQYFTKYRGYSDVESVLNMWNDLANVTQGNFFRAKREIRDWARNNSINYQKIKEALQIFKQIYNIFQRRYPQFSINIQPFTSQGVINAARPILSNVYSDSLMNHVRGIVYRPQTSRQDYRLSTKDTVNEFSNNPPLGLLALISQEIVAGNVTSRLISFALDISRYADGIPINPKPRSPAIQSSKEYQANASRANDVVIRNRKPEKIGNLHNKVYNNIMYYITTEMQKLVTNDDFSERYQLLKSIFDKYPNYQSLKDQRNVFNLNGLYQIYSTRDFDLEAWGGTSNLETRQSNTRKKLIPIESWTESFKPLSNHLDVGSGDGVIGFEFSSMFKLNTSFADDIDHRIIGKDRPFIKYKFNARFGLLDATFNIISTFHLLHHIPNDTQLSFRLQDLHRILGSNGLLIIREHSGDNNNVKRDIDETHLAYEINEIKQGMSESEFDLWYKSRPKLNIHSKADLIKIITAVGFELINSTDPIGAERNYYALFRKAAVSTKSRPTKTQPLSQPEPLRQSEASRQPEPLRQLEPLRQSPKLIYTERIASVLILTPVDLDREYARYNYVMAMHRFINLLGIDYTLKNKIEKSLERWLLVLANTKSLGTDPIFSIEKVSPGSSFYNIISDDLLQRNFPTQLVTKLIGGLTTIAVQFANLTSFPLAPSPIREQDDIIVGDYRRIFPSERIDLLLTKGNLLDIAKMSLRYSSLSPGGYQWSLPLNLYRLLVDDYGLTIEGFASPVNSQIIALGNEYKFCSIFLDTDAVFGSIGNFFGNNFEGQTVMVNPPFNPEIMRDTVDYILKSLDRLQKVRYFLVFHGWQDSEYYLDLTDAGYTPYTLTQGKHYYVDTNNGMERITPSFDSYFWIIDKGMPNMDYNRLGIVLDQAFSL